MKKGWWEEESLADVRKGMRCAKLGTDWIEIDLERHKSDQAVVEAAIEWMSVRDGLKEGRLIESISSLILAIKKTSRLQGEEMTFKKWKFWGV